MTDPAVLARLGLRPGEPIRFRPHGRNRWITGRVAGVGADGSITLHDPDGAARSMRPEVLEVRRPGPRGRLVWIGVTDVAITWEQLTLWEHRSDPIGGDPAS